MKPNLKSGSLVFLVLVSWACGNSGTTGVNATGGITRDATGGAASTGGSVGSGGASSPTGGSATGGTTPSTGGVATGGTPRSTGGIATGGTPRSTGGIAATGGTPRSTGGSIPGGTTATIDAGAGGRATPEAGTQASGDAQSSGTAAKPSAGCGKPAPAATSARQTIDVSGTAREFIVVYPTSYDPTRPYRVIYEFHGSGGTAEENVRFKWYGVQPLSNDSVIFVAPQGLGSPAGWPNSGGQDVAFIKKLVQMINETYCVDTSRIFVDGFSYGAMFSNTLGCQMADTFRAIAPASGGGPNGTCTGQVAAVVIHGSADTTVKIASGQGSRDFWIKTNHCGSTTAEMNPSPCVVYQGCDTGYPVAWCEHTGGHTINSNLFGPIIWNFFSQF